MRRLVSFGVAGVASAVVVFFASDCGSTDVTCEDLATCPRMTTGPDGGSGGAGGSGGTGGAGAGGAMKGDASSDTADGDAAAPCTSMLAPSESLCVNESIALLVSSRGNDVGATGKRGAEFKTIGAALRAAKTGPKRIYVCDDGAVYPEAITVDATIDAALDGIAIYGGFDCADWGYQSARRAKIAPASGPALMVKGAATGVTLVDLELASANATSPGASSIAAVLDSSMNVVFQRLKITAGGGADGAPGTDGAKGADALAVSGMQAGFAAGCPAPSPSQLGGGWPTTANVCGSLGGAGGTATAQNEGSPGLRGIPAGANNAGMAGGGDGLKGDDGPAGAAALANAGAGAFSAAGYQPASPGGDGGDGIPGQGGGGGGASHATGTTCLGASGGAGGMGGCAGKKGTGGASGGASVALVSWLSGLTLDHCDVSAANGGAGGKGGSGGLGGSGKDGAAGGPAYVSDAGDNISRGGHGGPGGSGGLGGSGAGGNGGPSYWLVYKGVGPMRTGGSIAGGMPGAAGVGGMQIGGVKAADGLPGPNGVELQVN
jgi:hypothetical protein